MENNVASRFGQRLVHTEKKYRDQALKKLRLYISKKNEWSDLDLDKLWKALFYCMWMSDKRTIQEELSTSLSLLIHQFTNVNLSLAFVHSFFRTMHREWPGIDGLRLDKFYSLIRKFIHQSLVLLGTEQVQWEMSFVKQFVNILEEEILCCGNSSSNGLRLHVIDLFLTEVFLSSHQKIRTKVFSVLIKPFFQILQKEKDKNVVKRVIELVFEPMINNTYHFQCTGSSSSCSPHQNKAHQNQKEEEENTQNQTDEEEEEEEEIKVFDHVELVEIQHQIFDLAAADATLERNRSVLYTLYSRFFQLTQVDSLKANRHTKKNDDTEDAATDEEEDSTCSNDDHLPSTQSKQDTKAQVEDTTTTPIPTFSTIKKKVDTTNKKVIVKEQVHKKQQQQKQKRPLNEQQQQEEEEEVTIVPTKKQKQEMLTQKQQAVVDTSRPHTMMVKKGNLTLQRCIVCKGFGKGLLLKGSEMCGHCTRVTKQQQQQQQQNKQIIMSNKKKQGQQAQVKDTKRVTFGKNKALPYSLSVKRLKASALKEKISSFKDTTTTTTTTTTTIKGLLKTTTTSTSRTTTGPKAALSNRKITKTVKKKRRPIAADFF